MDVIISQQIRFTNTSDLKEDVLQWFEWDFGDGDTDDTNWDTIHSYETAGTYIAKLTVNTSCGTCVPCTETINVYSDEEITCELGGCDLLLYYDTDKDGIISPDELSVATSDYNIGTLSEAEYNFIQDGYDAGSIVNRCPGCVHREPVGGGSLFAILAALAIAALAIAESS